MTFSRINLREIILNGLKIKAGIIVCSSVLQNNQIGFTNILNRAFKMFGLYNIYFDFL